MNCSIAKSLDEIGEWWSLLIVRECTQGSSRFDEFQRELGIARNILTGRLARLTDLGIIERFALEEDRATEGYRLTEKGEDLYPVLVALMQWGDRWCANSGRPPMALLEDGTGAPIEPIAVRGKGRKTLSFRDIRFVPGPSASGKTAKAIEGRNSKVLGRR